MDNKLTLCIEQIKKFLETVDDLFPMPLSSKTDLNELAIKFFNYAIICCEMKDDMIISMLFDRYIRQIYRLLRLSAEVMCF